MKNKHAESTVFSLGNKTLEEVKEYNYLRQVVIRRRISMG